METKNAKKTNGMFDETGKAGELLNNASSAMIDLYKKQLDTVFGFYNNIFNSAMNAGKNNWSFDFNSNPFLTSSNGFKSFVGPFQWLKPDGEYTGRLTSVYENFFRQTSEFNKNWLNVFQNTFQPKQGDWIGLNEKYQQLLEERWNATKAIIDKVAEINTKQLDFSLESNKKMLSELNCQMEKLLKGNMEFWENAVKTHSETFKNEEEKSHKATKKETYQHA